MAIFQPASSVLASVPRSYGDAVIAIVHGPDALLARRAVQTLLAERDPSGNATNYVDGKSTPLPQIISQVGSVGFFGQGRVVVVHNLIARATKGTRDDGDTPDAGALDLAPLLAATSADNLLVLVEPSLASVPAALRRVMPPETTVIAGEPPRGEYLLRWLSTTARQAGSDLDGPTARLLATRLYPQTWQAKPNNPRYDVPPDLDRLTQEIEKLAVAADPGPIGRVHIERLVAATTDDQVFRFTDALARRQTQPAVSELEKLLLAGEEPFALVAQAMQQTELAAVMDATSASKDPAAVGRDLGLSNPARMGGITAARRGQARGASRAEVAAAVAVDRKVKRGELRQPEDALYSLIADTAGVT